MMYANCKILSAGNWFTLLCAFLVEVVKAVMQAPANSQAKLNLSAHPFSLHCHPSVSSHNGWQIQLLCLWMYECMNWSYVAFVSGQSRKLWEQNRQIESAGKKVSPPPKPTTSLWHNVFQQLFYGSVCLPFIYMRYWFYYPAGKKG